MNLISTTSILFYLGRKGPHKPLHDVDINKLSGEFMVNLNSSVITHPSAQFFALVASLISAAHIAELTFNFFPSQTTKHFKSLTVELRKYSLWESHREEYYKHFPF